MAARRRHTGVMVYARERDSNVWHILVEPSKTTKPQVGLCMQIFRVATVHHGSPKNVCPGCADRWGENQKGWTSVDVNNPERFLERK